MKRWLSYAVLAFSFLVGGFVLGCRAQTPTSADSSALEQRMVSLENEVKTMNATITQLQEDIKVLNTAEVKTTEGPPASNDVVARKDIEALTRLICQYQGRPKVFYDYIVQRYGDFQVSQRTGALIEFGDGTVIKFKFP